jgi:predicted flap endonuclease-1-like 5' DNA nuclease
MRRHLPRAAAPLPAAVVATALLAGSTLWATPAADRRAESWVRRTLKTMTLEEKVGQLVVPGLNGVYTPLDSETADKLERLHGVGKKFAEALRGAGITTFAAVAESSVETLRAAIAGGSEASDAVANEETWPEQARLLAAGDDAGFDAYVAELKKG